MGRRPLPDSYMRVSTRMGNATFCVTGLIGMEEVLGGGGRVTWHECVGHGCGKLDIIVRGDGEGGEVR